MFSVFKKNKQAVTVGIQVSSGALSVMVVLHEKDGTVSITDYMTYPVSSPDVLTEVLPEIKGYIQEKKLKGAHCCFVLDDTDYQMLTIDPPNVPHEEMKEAVKWKVKDLISSPIGDVTVDVFITPGTDETAKPLANVVVVHKAVIEQISSLVEELELDLKAIDIPELSYRNYLERSGYAEQNIALVLVKENYGKLMVVNHNAVCFSRHFKIDYKAGLFDDLPESDIALELQRSLDYYERQLKHVVPPKILVIGENITEDKITPTIKESLNQKILTEGFSGFEFSEEDQLFSGRLMATYGGALRRGLQL